MTETTHQNYNMDNLWDIISSDNTGQFGIHGYIVPPRTVDCQKLKKDRDHLEFMEKVWKGKQLYPKPKEILDKDGKVIPPKRPNFFDDMEKAHNFGYSKEKEEAIKEKYSSKNRPYQIDPEKIEIIKEKDKAKFYRFDRVTYFDMLMKQAEKNFKHYPHMEQIIEKTKEEIEKSPKKMMLSEELKQKYSKRGSLPKDIRVSVFDGTQGVAERIPFYNSLPKTDKDKDDKQLGKFGKLFFPDISPVRAKSPTYYIKKPIQASPEIKEKKEEILKTKIEETNKKWEERKIKFIDDISVTYGKLNKVLGVLKYSKPVDKGEQYKVGRENNPRKSPGPQDYFKSPKYDPSKKPDKNEFPRNVIDKRVSKPMTSHLF